MIKQYVCLDCNSFYNPSGYKEDDNQKLIDFEFLVANRASHTSILGQLAMEIKTRVPHSKTYCEIGYGTGLLMKGMSNFGLETYGFEVNANCHRFVTEELQLPCELGLFDASHDRTYDIIASCMVFEHLEQPRELFGVMRSKLNRGGAIYLSVPFAHRSDWPFLWSAGTNPANAPPDIFYDNDVHILHFSVDGMKKMGMSMGARTADYWVSKDTYHHSPGSYHGVLFQF